MAGVALWRAYRFGIAPGDLQHFLARRMTWTSTCRRAIRESFTSYVPIAVSSAARLALNMPCHAMELKGRLEMVGSQGRTVVR